MELIKQIFGEGKDLSVSANELQGIVVFIIYPAKTFAVSITSPKSRCIKTITKQDNHWYQKSEAPTNCPVKISAKRYADDIIQALYVCRTERRPDMRVSPGQL